MSRKIINHGFFLRNFRQIVCPALDQLLNVNDLDSPRHLNDDNSRIRTNGVNRFSTPTIPKLVYAIIADIIRLVGTLKKIRCTLEPMFERISHCTQPAVRIEALKILKEVSIFDFCSR